MGLIAERLSRMFAVPRQAQLPVATSAPWTHWPSWIPRERDYTRDVGDGSHSNLVVPAMDFIAQGFIEAPVRVRQRADDELRSIADHPMPLLIRRPNPFYSGALLWMATLASWIADGNAYWLLNFSGAGRPAQIWWAPSWTIEPKGPDDGSEFLTHYEYRPNGRSAFRLPPEQVVHFRWGLDQENPRKGYSRLKSVLREIYSDEEASRFTAALLRNLGAPGILISPKGEGSIPFAEAQATKLDVEQKTTGDNRGRTVVMTSATDLTQWGFSPEQMDLARLRAIPESRIAAALGIPAAVLGFLAGMEQTKVGATMAELRELAYEQGILPKMRLFTEELSTQLLTHFTDTPDAYEVDFDLSDVTVLQDDANKLVARIDQRVRGGWMTVAAAKMAVGELPDAGDNVYLRGISIVETGPDALPDATPAPAIAARRMVALERRPTKQQVAYLRAADRAGQKVQARFAAELGSAFDDLGQRAAAAWQATPQRFVADPLDEPTVEAILAALDLGAWRTVTLDPLWHRHYLRTAELVYEALRLNLGLDVVTDLPDFIARQVVAAGGRQLGLVDLDQQTRQAIFDALSDARAAGMGPIEAAREIRRYVGAGRFSGMEAERPGAGVRYRSELIARTETLHAQRVSVAEAGRAAGFEHYLAFDNRGGFGDAECTARDGQVYTYDEMLAETAAEHPNGTLSFAPVPGSQVQAARGRIIEITRPEYDEDTGRMVRVVREQVDG